MLYRLKFGYAYRYIDKRKLHNLLPYSMQKSLTCKNLIKLEFRKLRERVIFRARFLI